MFSGIPPKLLYPTCLDPGQVPLTFVAILSVVDVPAGSLGPHLTPRFRDRPWILYAGLSLLYCATAQLFSSIGADRSDTLT